MSVTLINFEGKDGSDGAVKRDRWVAPRDLHEAAGRLGIVDEGTGWYRFNNRRLRSRGSVYCGNLREAVEAAK